MNRHDIVTAARAWIGTPYRHQGSLNGVGCDCLGLVRGVWRDLYGAEPETAPAYSPDWAETSGAEALADAGRRHLVEVSKTRSPRAMCCCSAGAPISPPNMQRSQLLPVA